MRHFLRILLLLAVIVCVAFTTPLHAQTGSEEAAASSAGLTQADYEEWNQVASDAEAMIDANEATDAEFNQLRNELVGWRDRFRSVESANSASVRAVQAQLDALGPAPAEGESEPEAVAQQRSDLQARLAELQEPARQAQVAYSQADALIQSVDDILRARQTEALLALGVSPLLPTNWAPAAEDLLGFLNAMVSQTVDAWNDPVQRAEFRHNLPQVLFLLVAASVLILRGRDWIEQLALRLGNNDRLSSAWLISFIVSLGQVALPVGGLALLSMAARSTGLLGPGAMQMMQSLPVAGLLLFLARWIAGHIFPISDREEPYLELTDQQRRAGRIYAAVLGAVLFVMVLLNTAALYDDWPDSTKSILFFPLIVLASVALYRLSRFFVLPKRNVSDTEVEGRTFLRQLTSTLGRLLGFIAIVGPILAAVGYFQIGSTSIVRSCISLMLIGILLILQKLLVEFYILLTHNRAGAKDALFPVVTGFMLLLLSLPMFALIWGARYTDLTEMWSRFMAGFYLGDAHISPSDFIGFLVIFVIGYGATRLTQTAMRTTILPKTKMDKGGQNAIVSGLGYIGIFLAGLFAITMTGINLSSLAIVAGALSVGVGFGLQTIVQNFVSGIILLVERPISEGDWIEVNGQMGFVSRISVRATRIETFDRTDVIVPNGDLISGMVTNWTRGNLIGRLIVKVGVAYGSDTRKVQELLQKVGEAQPLVLLNPPPGVIFVGFGDSSLDFELRMILRDVTQMLVVQTEVNHQIAEVFAREGIEIPFPQRDLWLRNAEDLRPQPGGKTDASTKVEAVPAKPAPVQPAPVQPTGPAPSHMRDSDTDGGGGDGDR